LFNILNSWKGKGAVMGNSKPVLELKKIDAVLFDMDGVLTATARVHSACWKRMFDGFLKSYYEKKGESFVPFDIEKDYKLYVDGKLRDEGVKSFLLSRKIKLPYGNTDDPPGRDTVCSLANIKFKMVRDVLETEGVDVFEGSIDLVKRLRAAGVKMAVVSSSKSCRDVLESVGITDLFDDIIDGNAATRLGLPGKPAPDTYLKAAELLDTEPARAVVVEDAISGVMAGRDGGFGLVVGVDREGNPEALKQNGADIVVSDLGEFTLRN
jgi:beta-phosphoglucomutase family hydrolase